MLDHRFEAGDASSVFDAQGPKRRAFLQTTEYATLRYSLDRPRVKLNPGSVGSPCPARRWQGVGRPWGQRINREQRSV